MQVSTAFITEEPRWIRKLFCEYAQTDRRNLENCALLGFHAASTGNILPTFRDNLSGSTLKFPENVAR